MIIFKLLLKEVKQENIWGYTDENQIKKGTVAFDFDAMVDDKPIEFKKGDTVYYQHGTQGVIEGEEYTLVSLTQLVSKN